MRRVALICMLVCTGALAAPAVLAGDGVTVYPAGSRPLGVSYETWGKRVWQYALGGSEANNPILNQGDCSVGQPQPKKVWFLIGAGEENVQSSCSVPHGAALLLSPSLAECSGLEDGLSSEADLRQCAEELADGFTVAAIEINGESIDTSGFRVTTPRFTFKAPANNILQADPVSTPMVGSMWLVMVHPLPPGEHTVVLRSDYPSQEFRADVTYKLTVLPATSTAEWTPIESSTRLLPALLVAGLLVGLGRLLQIRPRRR